MKSLLRNLGLGFLTGIITGVLTLNDMAGVVTFIGTTLLFQTEDIKEKLDKKKRKVKY